MAEPHRVQELCFQLEIGSEELALAMQERLAAFANGPLLRIVEEVFDQFGGIDEVLRLDTLAVDLGAVDGEDIEAHWAQRLREQLLRSLATQLAQSQVAAPERQASEGPSARWHTREEVDLDALMCFLSSGVLPWQMASSTDPVTLAERVWLHSSDALLHGLRALPQAHLAWRRLRLQFPPLWLQRLEGGLLPSTTSQALAQRGLFQSDAALDTVHSQRTMQAAPGQSGVACADDPVELDHGAMFVGNAGLVLLGPYLPRLFDSLGLAHNGAFVDAAANRRAVLLIQYLVTGQAEAPESVLVLNKLLCGLPLHGPVARQIDLTDAERDAAGGLLAAVIGHWTALGRTSSAGLQETFLQREGRLDHVDGAWQLQVQSRSFDMLLDRLPWGFATLKYPWMHTALRVNWR